VVDIHAAKYGGLQGLEHRLVRDEIRRGNLDLFAMCRRSALGPLRQKEFAMPSVDQLIVWIVVGLFGGGLAGALMTWERGGFGLFRNFSLGLAGALIGGLLFRVSGIWPGLDKIAISLRDVIAAFVGSLVVLAVLWIWQKLRSSEASKRS
jgi:uncharacterized membrane protein YeaQ/YmgE (transglycosylase-associated protein family)